MQLSDLTVEVRDKSLRRLGVIRPEQLVLDMDDEFNNIGHWKLELPAEHELEDALRTPGSGIIVTGPADVILSGPMTVASTTASSSDPGGTTHFEGVTDMVRLRDLLAYPDPGNPDPTTQTLSHDIRTGSAERVMHEYVNFNIGPGAPAARRVPKLIMGQMLDRGDPVRKTARFPVLGNLLADLAVLGDLGFRVVQRGENLVFETYSVRDLSKTIRLDVMNNTLVSQTVAISPPGLTRAIVAGQGDLVDRQFYEGNTFESVKAEELWGRRIERFVDQRQTEDSEEHTQAAAELLEKEGFTAVSVKALPMDDSTMYYGRDWSIGDKVSIVFGSGREEPSTAHGMVARIDASGVRFGVVLGDITVFDPDAAMAGRVTDTMNRVSALERNVEQGASSQEVLDVDKRQTKVKVVKDFQLTLTGGGVKTVREGPTASFVKWSQPFYVISAARGAASATSGFFIIDMPTSGVVSRLGSSSYTVSQTNGIPLEQYNVLWYKLPVGSASASSQSNFLITDYRVSGFDLGDEYVMVASRQPNTSASAIRWGTGEIQDYWHPLTLQNSWTVRFPASPGSVPPPAWRKDGSVVTIRGLLEGGSTADAVIISQLPGGAIPATTMHFICNADHMPYTARVDSGGRIQAIGLPTTPVGFLSLDGISYIAEA